MAGKGLGTEFKEFVLRGNVIDLAVAVVIGAAFGAVVTALVKDLLTPLIAIPGKANFQNLAFHVRKSAFAYGDFINAVISFLSIALAVFLFVVKPVNMLIARRHQEPTPEPAVATRPCPECLSEIPKEARRCKFCTAEVPPVLVEPAPAE
ncbi:MAG TPA: large conductance mechanosensitive channel protein MscL [Actinomycetota bacterium]|nr:large conductance mechanosensitive channel protein MscL [Actinomycetota bacterium]